MVEVMGSGLDASMFNIKAQSMDIVFDPGAQQQVLSFKFALTVALPQLLQQVVAAQQSSGTPAGLRGAAPSAMANIATVRDAPSPPNLQPPAPAPTLEDARMLPKDALSSGGVPAAGTGRDVSELHGPEPPSAFGRANAPGLGVQGPSPLQAGLLSPAQNSPSALLSQHDALSLGVSRSSPASASTTNVMSLNLQLMDAVRENKVQEARLALQSRADVNYADPSCKTPLHIALEAGGNIDSVNLLMQAQSNVNAGGVRGTTPLHYAIQQYLSLPPLVIRMLLSARADLSIADGWRATPLDSAKMIAMRSVNPAGAPPDSAARVRQLLNEVTEQPTVAVNVMEGGEVRSALFADLENDKIVFHTESSLCVYSLKQRRTIFVKKLRQSRVTSHVQHVSVNPVLGTIAVCLEMADADGSAVQNVSIIWPTGQLQEEEPLKLSINVTLPEGHRQHLPSCVILSRTQGPQMLLSRLCDGQVYCWRLNSGRSQLVSEVKLMSRAGLVATSDNGCWIAAVNLESLEPEVRVWSYIMPNGMLQNPRQVATVSRRPMSMAIASNGTEGNSPCLLAIVEATPAGQPQSPIEILMIGSDGASESVYRVRVPSPCFSLNFCYGSFTHLLSGHTDGRIGVYNLPRQQSSMSHDSQGTRSISISTDWTLLTSTEANYFRVFKVPSPEPS
mmetsp:Transcript_92937/g.240053  ORF Transcript_92937/g.240053 Transcript_92937/m.240053 type:complete len:675 (-) Transcript_92937:436-2460(-)